MTSQTPVSPDSSVLLLRELDIPGRTGPVPSGEWGINIAAARDNFPRQGLQCRAGPWGNMDVGDLLRIFWGADNLLLQETIDEQEKNTELTLFIPTGQFTNGFVDVSYSVRRLGGVPEPSEVMKVFVKLTRPGGQDQNGDTPGHSELHMVIPKEILDGGIDKDNVAAGVPITVQPYPNMAVNDVIQVTWGGKFVLSAPLTQRQVEKLDPIVVHIDEATIRDAGDSDSSGLAAAFEVYDVVDNRSEDWCAEQRVVVGVDQTRLTAPIVKEAQNNVLDVDKLGDKDGTVQVLAVDNNFKLGDIIVLRVRGTPLEGSPIDLEIEGEPLSNVPSVAELKVPNALLKQLAKTQVVFSYRLKKANGSPDLQSKGQFIRVIGEIQRLKAPIAEDAQQGAIDPELSRTRIEIPFDKSFAAGQAIKLFWLGTRPDKSTYLPDLGLRPISNGDIEAGESLFITVGGEHLATLKGGSLELYYQLLIEDSVLATFNRVNATHAIRESEHLAPLQVGEPRLELPEPKVDGVVNGALPADLPGTTLTVEYLNTVRDDVVTYEWVGSKTGKASDWITLNSFTAGKPVPFSIKAELIKGNEGGTVKASYSIKRAVGGEPSYSNPLELSVGAALVLSPPTVKEANGNSLNPIAAKDTLTIVVPKEVDLQPTDLLSVTWTGAAGTPAGGSHTTTPAPISSIGREIRIPVSVIAYNLGKAVTVSYSISRNGAAAHPSAPFLLNVSTLPAGELKASWILQADNDGEGPVLDLSKLTAGATVRSGVWPHIALGQFVWLDLEGTKADGSPHNKRLMFSPQSYVNQDWLNRGYYDVVGHSNYWKDLRDGSRLQVVFKAAFDKNANEDQATLFAVRTYTVRAATLINPTIDSVKGSPSGLEIPEGQPTVETAVTLTGMASKGQKVDVLDGAASKGQPTANANTGIWTLLVSGLSVATHSFTAKALYGAGPVSAARTFTVITVPELIVDISPVVLSGLHITADPVLNWALTGRHPAGTTLQRSASGGTPPYTYTSSNIAIVTVTAEGLIIGQRNGTATIVVRDGRGQEKKIPVTCSNNYFMRAILSYANTTHAQAISYMQADNGSPLATTIPSDRVLPINTKYTTNNFGALWTCAPVEYAEGYPKAITLRKNLTAELYRFSVNEPATGVQPLKLDGALYLKPH